EQAMPSALMQRAGDIKALAVVVKQPQLARTEARQKIGAGIAHATQVVGPHETAVGHDQITLAYGHARQALAAASRREGKPVQPPAANVEDQMEAPARPVGTGG